MTIHADTRTETLAGDVMARRLVTVAPTDSLLAAWELLARGGIHHLPVVVHGRCVSVVDDRILASELVNPLRPRRRIADVMPPRVHCVLADTPLRRTAEIMKMEAATAVPVVDDAMNLVGLVTDRDVVAAVADGLAYSCLSPRTRAP